jgi:hypothetical protein
MNRANNGMENPNMNTAVYTVHEYVCHITFQCMAAIKHVYVAVPNTYLESG